MRVAVGGHALYIYMPPISTSRRPKGIGVRSKSGKIEMDKVFILIVC